MNHPLGEPYDITMTIHTGEKVGVEINASDPVYPKYTVHHENGTTEDASEIFDDDDWHRCFELNAEPADTCHYGN